MIIQTILNYLDLIVMFFALLFMGWLFSAKIPSWIMRLSIFVALLILIGVIIGVGFNLVTGGP